MPEQQEKPEKDAVETELESPNEPTESSEDDGIDDGCGKQPVKGGN